LVLVVKYRRNVFDDDMSDYAKDMFVRLSENYNITLVEGNHDVDHVHILFKAHPNTEMTKFINAYKSAISRLIKRDFPTFKSKKDRKSYTTNVVNGNIMLLNGHIKLPKLKM
uniref:IS200/IS605 family transposase n=1 Tax=Bacillus thuringiensis TaxID=1428 RepID=UPI00301725E6